MISKLNSRLALTLIAGAALLAASWPGPGYAILTIKITQISRHLLLPLFRLPELLLQLLIHLLAGRHTGGAAAGAGSGVTRRLGKSAPTVDDHHRQRQRGPSQRVGRGR